jgi:type IV secretory pathway ATPase VirB11/archaellum biosynthesis ATPase
MSARNKKYASVENHNGYLRDLNSNAIVSNDRAGYEVFVAKKKEKREMRDRLAQVEASLDRIIDKLDSLEHLKND